MDSEHTCSCWNGSIGCAECAKELTAEIAALRAEVEFLSKNRAENLTLRTDIAAKDAKYSDLLQSHHSLCCKVEELKNAYAISQNDLIRANLQNGELRDALQNMAGLFGEAVTRLQMGKGFSELHAEAVKGAKAILAKTERRDAPQQKIAVDWQCRSVSSDKLCCQKEKGHPGDHRYWDDKIDAQWKA